MEETNAVGWKGSPHAWCEAPLSRLCELCPVHFFHPNPIPGLCQVAPSWCSVSHILQDVYINNKYNTLSIKHVLLSTFYPKLMERNALSWTNAIHGHGQQLDQLRSRVLTAKIFRDGLPNPEKQTKPGNSRLCRDAYRRN